jgi:hypothetical protein
MSNINALPLMIRSFTAEKLLGLTMGSDLARGFTIDCLIIAHKKYQSL